MVRWHSTTQAPVQTHLKHIRGAWGTRVSCAQAASDDGGRGGSHGGTGMKKQPRTLTWPAHNNGHPAAGVTTLLTLWKMTAVALMLTRCCVKSTVLWFNLNTQKESLVRGADNRCLKHISHNTSYGESQCKEAVTLHFDMNAHKEEGHMLTLKIQTAMMWRLTQCWWMKTFFNK